MRWRTSAPKAVRARQLRREQTPAEAILWRYLRAHRMLGLHFRRQHPIDRLVVDFCCTELNIIIDVDGPVHVLQLDYDAARTQVLERLGYRVLRWTNAEIENDIDRVLAQLRGVLELSAHQAE